MCCEQDLDFFGGTAMVFVAVAGEAPRNWLAGCFKNEKGFIVNTNVLWGLVQVGISLLFGQPAPPPPLHLH
jgi:hypothetical protein